MAKITRAFLHLALALLPAIALCQTAQINNVTRPGSSTFQVGDRFEVQISGARANQPVSVRTMVNGHTDWSPVIAWTDLSGQWSTQGQFDRSDFGYWKEVWTVGGKLANPSPQFGVIGACLPGGQHNVAYTGMLHAETCETTEGTQVFATASESEPFHTPDGRVIAGLVRRSRTAEQYQAEVMEDRITSREDEKLRTRSSGDRAAVLIRKIIGVNALNDHETRNVLTIVRAAYANPDQIPDTAKMPTATLALLRSLSDATNDDALKQQIADTITFVQAQ